MSSTENNPQIDTDPNSTLISSFLSTTATTVLTNISLNHHTQSTKIRTRNLTLLIGCLVGCVILIIIVIYAFIKYRNRDEGSYKIDESKNFVSNSPLPKHESNAGGSKPTPSAHHRQKLLANQEQNGVDSREWYV